MSCIMIHELFEFCLVIVVEQLHRLTFFFILGSNFHFLAQF